MYKSIEYININLEKQFFHQQTDKVVSKTCTGKKEEYYFKI